MLLGTSFHHNALFLPTVMAPVGTCLQNRQQDDPPDSGDSGDSVDGSWYCGIYCFRLFYVIFLQTVASSEET